MKRKVLIFSLGLLLLGASLVIVFQQYVPQEDTGFENEPASESTLQVSDLPGTEQHSNTAKQKAPAEQISLEPLPDQIASERGLIQSDPSLAHYTTPSTTVSIRDEDGNLLYQADADNPFINIKSVNGGEHVAINRGDGRFRVVNQRTLEAFDLPQSPPVQNPIGFAWEWMSNDTLIGVAGAGYDAGTKPASRCCDEHVVKESRLYVYDVADRTLRSVQLPESFVGKVFKIGNIAKDGSVELISESGHEDDGNSLGWFRFATE